MARKWRILEIKKEEQEKIQFFIYAKAGLFMSYTFQASKDTLDEAKAYIKFHSSYTNIYDADENGEILW